jgi:hypothetical protein
MSGTTGYRVDPGTGFGAGIALVKTGGLLSGYVFCDKSSKNTGYEKLQKLEKVR